MHHRILFNSVDPRWFRRAKESAGVEGVVLPDGTVDSGGTTLRFAEPPPYAPGTPVVIYLHGRNLACSTRTELDDERGRHERERERVEADRQRRDRDRVDAKRRDAEAFNSSISMPVRWDIGEKLVLSGLYESRGDGRNSASVEHVRLLEDLDAGRLKRKAGDFLCGPAGARDWAPPLRHRDGDGHEYMPAPTCKACLRLLARWRRTPGAVRPRAAPPSGDGRHAPRAPEMRPQSPPQPSELASQNYELRDPDDLTTIVLARSEAEARRRAAAEYGSPPQTWRLLRVFPYEHICASCRAEAVGTFDELDLCAACAAKAGHRVDPTTGRPGPRRPVDL